MRAGSSERVVDLRIAEYGVKAASLIGASPVYDSWRRKILELGQPARMGCELVIGEDVRALVSADAAIAFVTQGIPTTRMQLRHAVLPDPTDSLRYDAGEQFFLMYDVADDHTLVRRVFEAASGHRLSIRGEAHAVTLGHGLPRVELKRVGTKYMTSFSSDWVPLDVLRLVDEDGYLVGGVPLLADELPITREALALYTRRLTFLSNPAARTMMRRIRAGQLTDGTIDTDLLGASYLKPNLDLSR